MLREINCSSRTSYYLEFNFKRGASCILLLEKNDGAFYDIGSSEFPVVLEVQKLFYSIESYKKYVARC